MCPAMIADPMDPGRGLLVYQPATSVLDGTWSSWFLVRPRWRSRLFTPMTGMISVTGRATWSLAGWGTGAPWPVGMATNGGGPLGVTAGWPGCSRAAARPQAPIPVPSRPQPSTAIALHLLTVFRRRCRGGPTGRGRPPGPAGPRRPGDACRPVGSLISPHAQRGAAGPAEPGRARHGDQQAARDHGQPSGHGRPGHRRRAAQASVRVAGRHLVAAGRVDQVVDGQCARVVEDHERVDGAGLDVDVFGR